MKFKENKTKTDPHNKDDITVSCGNIKKGLDYEGHPVIYINIKYPEFSLGKSKKSELYINKYYETLTGALMNFSKHTFYKRACVNYKKLSSATPEQDRTSNFKPFSILMSYEITYNKEFVLCIVINTTVYSGQGKGNTTRRVQIWNINSGTLLPLKDFIKFNSGIKKQICEDISIQASLREEKGDEHYIYTETKDIARFFNKKNMFITDTGYTFFFPQGSIAPHSFECPEFPIMRNRLIK